MPAFHRERSGVPFKHSKDYHDEDTFESVARHQNHSVATAEKNYVTKSDTRAVNDYLASVRVKQTKMIAEEALENAAAWFPLRPSAPLPDLESMQATLIRKTSFDSSEFELSPKWYAAILARIKENLRESTIQWLIRCIHKGTATVKKASAWAASESSLRDKTIGEEIERRLQQAEDSN